MGAVLSLAKAREELTPHLSGAAKCVGCQHEWVAVAPVETVVLKCPACHFEKGFFANPVMVGEKVWQCRCGNDLFRISALQQVYCVNCAAPQVGWFE